MWVMAISTVKWHEIQRNETNANRVLAILLFNDKEQEIAEEVVHRMVKRAVEMEGTVTGEHGVGLIKRDYLTHELGETTVDAMRKVSLGILDSIITADFVVFQLKQAFDPLCLLNCDKIVRVQKAKAGEVQPW